jgi:co-chaperonin GroES (HSP10)
MKTLIFGEHDSLPLVLRSLLKLRHGQIHFRGEWNGTVGELSDLEVATESGIIFEINPDPVLNRPTTGIVYKKGKKVKDMEEGDLVHFTKEAGADIKTKDGWFVLMNSSRVLGKYC